MTPRLHLTDTPDAVMRQAIVEPLVRFNLLQTGGAEDYRPLAVLLLHQHADAVIGGLWGATYFAHLAIELLFVPATLRGGGVGRQLMAAAEQEARARACIGVWVDTFSFQARGFYERLGYTVFGTIQDYPPGHSRFFLKKTLAADPPA